VKENLIFRAWYYFRQGWSIYFAFIFSAINTFTVTYYLAIQKAPILKELFPSFALYVIITTAIGIPLLTIVGYVHVRRSYAYKAEADIGFEANPHFRRMLLNTEEILRQHLKISKMIVKLSKNEKLTDEDLREIDYTHDNLDEYTKKRTLKE
jgi:hypothetical protein